MLTEQHLVLSMEYAACGSLTGYVAERWQDAQRTGLFLGENEARYFFRVSRGLTLVRYTWLRCSPPPVHELLHGSHASPCSQCAADLPCAEQAAVCSNSWTPCRTATITTWLTGVPFLAALHAWALSC